MQPPISESPVSPEEEASSASVDNASQETSAQRQKLSLVRRAVFLLCGLALLIGFFLPWVTAGTAIELSGLGLIFSGGDVVQAISGSGRFLLVMVPLLGAVLIVGAVTARRWTVWVGTIGAGALLLFGIFHVILLFMSSTGLGMWLVVFSSLSTLVFGALSVGRRKTDG